MVAQKDSSFFLLRQQFFDLALLVGFARLRRVENFVTYRYSDLRWQPLGRAIVRVGEFCFVLMCREEVDLAILHVVVVVAPHTIEGEEGIDHPSLLEGVRISDAKADHHTPASSETLLEGDEFIVLEEEWTGQIEGLHSGIGTHIETLYISVYIETVLSLEDSKTGVDIVAVAPTDSLVWREHRVNRDRRVWSYHEFELRVDDTHTGV